MSTFSLPPSALRALALRAFVLWALVHALTFVALTLIQGGGSGAADVGDPAAPNPMWITVVSTALLLADVRRRGERALWGNLGISLTQLALLGAVVCVAGETLIAIARR